MFQFVIILSYVLYSFLSNGRIQIRIATSPPIQPEIVSMRTVCQSFSTTNRDVPRSIYSDFHSLIHPSLMKNDDADRNNWKVFTLGLEFKTKHNFVTCKRSKLFHRNFKSLHHEYNKFISCCQIFNKHHYQRIAIELRNLFLVATLNRMSSSSNPTDFPIISLFAAHTL